MRRLPQQLGILLLGRAVFQGWLAAVAVITRTVLPSPRIASKMPITSVSTSPDSEVVVVTGPCRSVDKLSLLIVYPS